MVVMNTDQEVQKYVETVLKYTCLHLSHKKKKKPSTEFVQPHCRLKVQKSSLLPTPTWLSSSNCRYGSLLLMQRSQQRQCRHTYKFCIKKQTADMCELERQNSLNVTDYHSGDNEIAHLFSTSRHREAVFIWLRSQLLEKKILQWKLHLKVDYQTLNTFSKVYDWILSVSFRLIKTELSAVE